MKVETKTYIYVKEDDTKKYYKDTKSDKEFSMDKKYFSLDDQYDQFIFGNGKDVVAYYQQIDRNRLTVNFATITLSEDGRSVTVDEEHAKIIDRRPIQKEKKLNKEEDMDQIVD